MIKELLNAENENTISNSSESKYKVDELANASSRFKVSKELVEAAFKIAGKTEATLYEAEQIINEFMLREVK